MEFKSVYQDRNEHDREQQEARERSERNFQSTANSLQDAITQSQTQFNATLANSNKQFTATMSGLNENLNVSIGDDTICYVKLASMKLRTADLKEDELGKLPMVVDLVKRGKYPLYSIYMWGLGTIYYKIPPPGMLNLNMMVGTQSHLPDLPEGDTKDSYYKFALPYHFDSRGVDVHLSFNARNGVWHQILLIRRADDKVTSLTNWSVATRIYKIEIKKSTIIHKFIFEKVDKDFPEKQPKWDVSLLAP